MKRLLLLSVMLLGACSYMPFNKDKEQEAEKARRAASARKPVVSELASDGSKRVMLEGVEIVKVEFRAGVSSATVENLAKREGCIGGPGAGLVSEPGPVEVYRMACDNGKIFMAKCELRQCKAMSR
ncbi:MAG: hypothetical protein V4724_11385 [Pseudomonadota bacterium]